MADTLKQISFAKLEGGMEMPHLLDIQVRAFEALLQTDAAAAEREDIGLERVFKDLFPISDVHENFSLEFVRYSRGEPKYSVEECIERDMTYSAPLKATLQLVINETLEDGTKRPRNIIEKEVYLGELPLLTPLGTFVINGAERVIVSQLHRSPGVVFEEATHPNGQRLISARIIPFRSAHPPGHVRHQRRRACHRQPAAPVARCGVRGGDAPERPASHLRAHHPVQIGTPPWARSSSTAPSVSSSASCTGRPVWCSRRRRTRTASVSSPRASSRSAARGSNSPSTSTTWCTSTSTRKRSSRPPRCCARSAMEPTATFSASSSRSVIST